jgi:hypothetical protein
LEFGPIIFCHLYICTRYNAIQKDREEIEWVIDESQGLAHVGRI